MGKVASFGNASSLWPLMAPEDFLRDLPPFLFDPRSRCTSSLTVKRSAVNALAYPGCTGRPSTSQTT